MCNKGREAATSSIIFNNEGVPIITGSTLAPLFQSFNQYYSLRETQFCSNSPIVDYWSCHYLEAFTSVVVYFVAKQRQNTSVKSIYFKFRILIWQGNKSGEAAAGVSSIPAKVRMSSRKPYSVAGGANATHLFCFPHFCSLHGD